jgi:eukaryotic-like serine/threonine-protein kinase
MEEVEKAARRAAIAGDDPVVAASALLRLRLECLREQSEICLQGVNQAGSIALAADLSELRRRVALPGAGAWPGGAAADAPPPEPPTLVERLGGTAVVSVPPALLGDASPDAPPASLLMIRSEAGWRIRDVL